MLRFSDFGLAWLDFGWISVGFRLDFGLDFGFGLDLARFWFGLIWIWLDFEWISVGF